MSLIPNNFSKKKNHPKRNKTKITLHPNDTPNRSSRWGLFITQSASAALKIGHKSALNKNEPIAKSEINDMIATTIPK